MLKSFFPLYVQKIVTSTSCRKHMYRVYKKVSLGQAIRKDTLITGIKVPGSPGKEAKCSQYADDATLLLTSNFSVTRAFYVINIFEQGSESKLNPEKNRRGLGWL